MIVISLYGDSVSIIEEIFGEGSPNPNCAFSRAVHLWVKASC